MYTIYTQDLCGYCTLAKQLLEEITRAEEELSIVEFNLLFSGEYRFDM